MDPFLGPEPLPLSDFFKGPSLKTLCKLAVIQYNLDQSCLPHDIRYSERWERRDRVRVCDLMHLFVSIEGTEVFVLLEM